MTITDFQNLTGTTVAAEDTNRIKAVIARSTAKLEGLLGYSLSKQKTWTELGKVQYNGYTPFPSLPVSEDVKNSLLLADEAAGDLQLFTFNEGDKHIKINPAKTVYRVKLVLPVDEDNFITISELESGTPYVNGAGLVTAITRSDYDDFYTWWGLLSIRDRAGLMIAVDADFVSASDLSQFAELNYLLADMVTFYADPNYSLLGIVKSESTDTHSYSRASTGTTSESVAPEGQPSAQRIIAKYAGPAAFRNVVA